MSDRITVEDLRKAFASLDRNDDWDRPTVYPAWAATIMRERGTWDDRTMVEQKPLPPVKGSIWKRR